MYSIARTSISSGELFEEEGDGPLATLTLLLEKVGPAVHGQSEEDAVLHNLSLVTLHNTVGGLEATRYSVAVEKGYIVFPAHEKAV